ncbi:MULTISPECIES: cysteine hydrolase family protein [unclassified Clostridioides]|uniref:cysteine hydrolase family protein n=1 Tax=unclassified Clostridioides TaxID=2635829 RepID=UPI001D0FB1DE|nr:cysteine hydrolase [Clostridioides sp. ZZV15-6388]MCC0644489.1 cysteine hydrolase [Clostridioides sp. ZZV14-6150]MCC0663741.1 cysteine hydrolase [Clostridioides sp. ZZV15-6597]MCC0719444.1 cysteine hydrolase [Clostridioides sp. ZZV14-6105]MCC0723793.1 cysteine hydrolase [Clostridioides sp. ZZV14-6104]MCC0742164.1 cysteine hydrolase [Clostridioides sp. ZZV14-6044]MCC0752116.1 cysteine hydrolase [Clostridioides sp. ZZV13-5731]
MSIALILIDIQNDYFKNGKCELFNTEKTAENAKKILTLFRKNNLPIIHVQHISMSSTTSFFLPDTYGSKINKIVFPLKNEEIIIKHTPDSFFKTCLQSCLEEKNIDKLVICGMMSHMCIDTSVRTAKKLGYDITLISDACTTKNLFWDDKEISAETVHQVFMASLQHSFADIKNTDIFLSNYCK